MKQFNVAIVGCGAISKNHGQAILDSPDAKLLYCVDVDMEKAVEFSKRFGGIPKTNYNEVISDPRVDIVHICTPHNTHSQLSIEAMEKGKHVFCEKPMAILPEDGEKMIEAAKRNERYLGVCFQNRMNQTTIMAKEAIDSGEYGQIVSVMARVAWDRHGKYYSDSPWRGRYATEGGGVIINQAIHTIDLLDYLCGGVKKVTAIATKLRTTDDYEVDDSCMANLELNNGSTAVAHFTNCYTTGRLCQLDISCEKAKIVVEQQRIQIIENEKINDIKCDVIKGEKSEWGVSHGRLIQDFYDCIRNQKPFFIDGQSAINAILIVDAIKRSNGMPIDIRI
ncbi:MAG TPA: Gfo/Idh/MocA family oxidoreductase [Thermoclostridium sp.]|nr:Gfo/Idh/MocA family oxidoreductase [Thermoclostridium sp.]